MRAASGECCCCACVCVCVWCGLLQVVVVVWLAAGWIQCAHTKSRATKKRTSTQIIFHSPIGWPSQPSVPPGRSLASRTLIGLPDVNPSASPGSRNSSNKTLGRIARSGVLRVHPGGLRAPPPPPAAAWQQQYPWSSTRWTPRSCSSCRCIDSGGLRAGARHQTGLSTAPTQAQSSAIYQDAHSCSQRPLATPAVLFTAAATSPPALLTNQPPHTPLGAHAVACGLAAAAGARGRARGHPGRHTWLPAPHPHLAVWLLPQRFN